MRGSGTITREDRQIHLAVLSLVERCSRDTQLKSAISVTDTLSLPGEGGLLVVEVERGSAAEEPGLRGARRTVVIGNYEIPVGGDLIMNIDGRAVESRDALSRAMNRKRPGETMELTVFRGSRTVKVKVKLGEGSSSESQGL